MPKTRPPYAPEFRRQMVDLVHAGRDPGDLAREFEPSAQAIRNWVAQADRREGGREAKPPGTDAPLSAAKRDELVRLRRENKQLRVERDILSRAAAGTHRARAMGPGPGLRARPARSRPGLPVHEGEPGHVPR
jgi:transposase